MAHFRATAVLNWNFETSDEDALALANKTLNETLSKDFKFSLKVEELKEKVKKVQLGEFKLEEVIPFITKSNNNKKEYECDGKKYIVKMNSQRYFLLKDCINCVACGLKGTKMLLEYHPADKSPHFNLYGEEDGKLILMTKDHIRAKAFGGEDRHSNYQIMCLTCNNLKSHSNITLEGVRLLRNIYNENKDKMTKKKLHALIEETRSKIQQPWAQKKKPKKIMTLDSIATACDIFVYCKDDTFLGKSVYDICSDKHIGCIKKGVFLELLLATKDKIMCKLPDSDEAILLHHSLTVCSKK